MTCFVVVDKVVYVASEVSATVDISDYSQGFVASHRDYPAFYQNNINSTLKLTGLNTKPTNLTFTVFSLDGKNCSDFLTLRFENRTRKLCGKRSPFTITNIRDDNIIFNFVTDKQEADRGFFISYKGMSHDGVLGYLD